MRNKRESRTAAIAIACCASVLAGLTGCASKPDSPKEQAAQANAFRGDPNRGAQFRAQVMASQSKVAASMEKEAAAKAAPPVQH